MSNTIAHLAVAQKVLAAWPDLTADQNSFYLGALAPDTIGSKPGCTREDKKRVHLRQDIRDADWLNADKMQLFDERVMQFCQSFILNPSLSPAQQSFNTGYLVHLLTDKWNHKTIRQTMLEIAHAQGVLESDREFFHMMTNDLEALDHYLSSNHPEILELFSSVTARPANSSLPGYIETEYLDGSIRWWKERYLPGIESRELLYLTESEIDHFILLAAKEITGELKQLLLQL